MTAAVKGPEWWYAFLRARNVPFIRVWFALGCRESGADPSCLYPAGAPWGDWVDGNGRKFDAGVLQINVVHLEALRQLYGPDADMRIMLDPEKCLSYAQRLAKNGFGDWGLKVSSDGLSYSFDWRSYPQSWVSAYAAESEAGFRKWWNAYPSYAAPLPSTAPKPPTPAPSGITVILSDVQLGRANPSVKIVQAALNRVIKAGLVVDGQFGPKTQAAYDNFRRSVLGWRGPDAMGSIGRTSLRELGRRAGFSVVG